MMADPTRAAEILEALLLVTDRPLPADRIASVIPQLKPEELPALIEALNQSYEATGRAFRARHVAGGYRLYTLGEYQSYIDALAVTTREARLSQAALETLAVVAYKQPVSRGDVEYVRGCDCDGVIRTLLGRKLITIKGRSDAPGRPLLYATTNRFLEYFGLETITDLPDWGEIAALVGDPVTQTRLKLVRPQEEAETPDTPSDLPASVPQDARELESPESELEPELALEEEIPVGIARTGGAAHLPPGDEA
jgi:segregation and condensation protein B